MSKTKVLVTGGRGLVGSAINKIACKYEYDFLFINSTHCDLTDFGSTFSLFKSYKPDYVIHTGALKRVDDMEFYPDECVKTNIEGSENVARASLLNNVKKCILVSTDKACQPTNVYGSSKFIAERIFTNYDYNSTSTIFASVRYGNVIASRGSFVPLFMDWIKNNKTIRKDFEKKNNYK